MIKKLLFSLPLELSLLSVFWQLNSFLKDPFLIFGFGVDAFLQILYLVFSIVLAALFFAIFVTLAQDWKITLPVILAVSITPLALMQPPENIILAIGTVIALMLPFLLLRRELLSYLTFKPTQLLLPSIRKVMTLIALVAAISLYSSSSQLIKQNGFTLPEALFDEVLKLNPLAQAQPGLSQTANQTTNSQIQNLLSPEQLQLLKQNPQALKDAGLDPSILDTLTQQPQSKPQLDKNLTVVPQIDQQLLKKTIQDQVQTMIKPYLNYIPILLGLLFFVSLTSLGTLVLIILPGLVWIIFFLLEKTHYTQFTSETREVKKLVV